VQREEPLQAQSDVSALLASVHLLWSHKMARTSEDIERGTPPVGRALLLSAQRAVMLAKNVILHNIIHYCIINLHFAILCLRSIEGDSVDHSWDPSTRKGPVAK
jgi:hypothetical protein